MDKKPHKMKYTLAEVRKHFEKNKCKFLDPYYVNAHHQHRFRCSCGNEKETISFAYFRKVLMCSICRRIITRWDTMKVSKVLKSKGFELLSDYTNMKNPIKVKCPYGHIRNTTFDSWLNCGDLKCMGCSDEGRSERKKTPYDKVKQLFFKRGCQLITSQEEYKGVKYKVDYICKCGNAHSISPDVFKNGVDCPKCGTQKLKETNIAKYGHECVLSNKLIREKILKTVYKNQTAPTSKQQLYLFEILGGKINFPIKTLQVDLAFEKEKIYVEYDGSGHDLKVKLGRLTVEEFNEKCKRRSYVLYRRGWREIRIISRRDYLPSEEVIKEMYTLAIDYFSTGHSWMTFDIDRGCILSSIHNDIPYNFGKLRRIRADAS
ncbi:hypothetical protein ABE65_016250 [Fictibacillus phosphorivorans]|uniref:Uncharacterized protein n=1 Tax=Fictibacillus phosphorivorans TaxID=1221500 RepID=A0A160IQ29_9BACL|nr:hypothetical protein [Fictibacillus phosphorivorans]ANC78267.1 hypothetical protein ABE65_016250 [Fictibacillus phosphorivorans]